MVIAGFTIGCARFHRQPPERLVQPIDAPFPVCEGPWSIRGLVGLTLRPLGGKNGSFLRRSAGF
jgi:hypothetical protein